MENHSYDRIIGDACCPYINFLARRGVLFTRWYGIRYPSLPNYLAMAGGSTFGRTTDDTSPLVAGPNLFDQLTAAGVSWSVYEESMPAPCYRGAFASGPGGTYALKHDPAMLFAEISGSAQCRNVVPFARFDVDALPSVAFVTPNMCHDMHDCPAEAGDRWLSLHVPAMLHSGATVLITWDTGDPDHTNGGGHVATILAGPGVGARRVNLPLNHYSICGSIEAAYGLRQLAHAASAPVIVL